MIFAGDESGEEYITPLKAAKMVGCSRRTIYNWIALGKVEVRKHPITKGIVIKKSDLLVKENETYRENEGL